MNDLLRDRQLAQNDISAMRMEGVDLAPRWEEILRKIAGETGFVPDLGLLRKSEWWKTGKIGAVHCPGAIVIGEEERRRAVLKIQGTRPATSEAEMIRAFARVNRGERIRPPEILGWLPWDDKEQFEALVLEEVRGRLVVSGHPTNEEELAEFFGLYEEYRRDCRGEPWVARPAEWSYREQVKRWRAAVEEQARDDPLRRQEDGGLVERGIRVIETKLTVGDLEFCHGHFQPGDLIVTEDGKVVLFSNLFWSWRVPFYDVVFGYHWWMLGMEHAGNLNRELLEYERGKWLGKIFGLSEVVGNERNIGLVNLALLERAVPALVVDRYMMKRGTDAERIVVEGARRELKRLLLELHGS